MQGGVSSIFALVMPPEFEVAANFSPGKVN